MEETGEPGENYQLSPSHWQTLSHNVVSKYTLILNHISLVTCPISSPSTVALT
jgi:hypothetical protein